MAIEGYSDLHFAAMGGHVDEVKAAIKRGCLLDSFDEIGQTPLHYAAAGRHLEIMSILIKAGADINAQDESQIGDTPLGSVAGNCPFEVAKVLVDAGANPTVRGWMGLSALDRAKNRQREEGKRVYELLCKAALRFSSK